MKVFVLIILLLSATTTQSFHIRHHVQKLPKSDPPSYQEDLPDEEVAVVRLRVPPHVAKGQDAELECQWRVPSLYSLKWYFNDQELFGLRPGEVPSRSVHHLQGIRVDSKASTGRRLVLSNVGVGAGGRYKCEVIGEAPDFLTADRSAEMRVVHIPTEAPSIQGTKTQYRVGQRVHLACVSPPSRPATSLTWFINDKQAAEEYVFGLNTTNIWGDGLLETRAGLTFVLQPFHFDHHGQLQFRCAASIPGLYHKVRQHTIGGAAPHATHPPPPSLPPPSTPRDGVKAPVMESKDIAAAALDGSSGVSKPVLPLLLLTLLTLLLHLRVS